MKMDNKKRIIIVCIVVAILLVSLIGYNVYRDQKEKAYYEAERQELRKTIVDGSVLLGITDLEVISVEDAVDESGNRTSYYVTYANSDQFGQLTYEQMVDYFKDLDYRANDINPNLSYFAKCILCDNEYDGLRILTNGHEYMCSYDSYDISWILYEDGVEVYEYQLKGSGKGNPSNSNNGKKKCYLCNGTGVVKYYYGESDLEAMLDGHEASWYGQCGSCQGTGYED